MSTTQSAAIGIIGGADHDIIQDDLLEVEYLASLSILPLNNVGDAGILHSPIYADCVANHKASLRNCLPLWMNHIVHTWLRQSSNN